MLLKKYIIETTNVNNHCQISGFSIKASCFVSFGTWFKDYIYGWYSFIHILDNYILCDRKSDQSLIGIKPEFSNIQFTEHTNNTKHRKYSIFHTFIRQQYPIRGVQAHDWAGDYGAISPKNRCSSLRRPGTRRPQRDHGSLRLHQASPRQLSALRLPGWPERSLHQQLRGDHWEHHGVL